MTTIYNDCNGNLRIGQIDIFLEISIENYFAATEYKIRKKNLLKIKEKIIDPDTGEGIEFSGLNNLEELFDIQDKCNKHEIQGVISLAIFYEALINEIGIMTIPDFKENFEPKQTKIKWQEIIKLVYNKEINYKAKYYSSMLDIIKVRNQLVHYKTKPKSEFDKNIDYFKVLKSAILSFNEFVIDLKNLDKEKGIISFYKIEKLTEKLNNNYWSQETN